MCFLCARLNIRKYRNKTSQVGLAFQGRLVAVQPDAQNVLWQIEKSLLHRRPAKPVFIFAQRQGLVEEAHIQEGSFGTHQRAQLKIASVGDIEDRVDDIALCIAARPTHFFCAIEEPSVSFVINKPFDAMKAQDVVSRLQRDLRL